MFQFNLAVKDIPEVYAECKKVITTGNVNCFQFVEISNYIRHKGCISAISPSL